MEKKLSKSMATLNWGIILGIILVLYSVILYAFGQLLNQGLTWVSYILMIGVIFYGAKTIRDTACDGVMSYGRALGTGTLISVYGAVIVALYTYILYSFIDTELINSIIELMEEKLLEQGIPDDQIETIVNMQKKFTTPSMISVMTVPSFAFFGFIISLITSIFVKKAGNPFNESMADIIDEE